MLFNNSIENTSVVNIFMAYHVSFAVLIKNCGIFYY